MNSLHVGGAEVGMSRLLNGLDEEQYDVTVIALNGHSMDLIERIPAWVKIFDLRLSEKRSVAALRKLWSVTRNADVIVGSLFHAVMVARMAGMINPDATVATWKHNGQFKTEFRKAVFEKTYLLSDITLTDSDPVAEMLLEMFEFEPESIHTVPIAGIDIDEFEPVVHEPSEPVVVGSVGRIVKEKNYTTLLEVAERFSGQEVKFEIAGDGELLSNLTTAAQRRNISNVKFYGNVNEIPKFLSKMDIYFQPSIREGLCITVLEAMATGLPVVGSNVGGIERNVTHGETGYLYEPNNLNGFYNGIETLVSNPQLRKQFGTQGRQIVSDRFTQEKLVQEFEKAINTL